MPSLSKRNRFNQRQTMKKIIVLFMPTVNNQILRVNMANIRRKLEANPADPQFIITETGVGYRMIDHAEENV